MKKVFKIAIFLFAVILLFSSCAPEEIPERPEINEPGSNGPSEPVSSEQEEQNSEPETEKTEDEKIIYEAENELQKFEATDIGQIQLLNDYYAFVNGLNNEVIMGEYCKTTISGYELETGKAEILFSGEAYFDYINLLYVHEMDFSNPWIFNCKKILSKSIGDNPDIEYNVGGKPYECDFDFANKRYIYIDENDKSKLCYTMLETGKEGLLFDVSGEGEDWFINSPAVNSDTGNVVFMVCEYSVSSQRKLVCLDYWGNVIFEETIGENNNYDLRWLNNEEFAMFLRNPDEEISGVRVYNIQSGLKSEAAFDFYYENLQTDMIKSYPNAVLCEYVPQSYYSYRLWLYNFENGSCKEIYVSPTKGVLRAFDLSPSGKTLAWIENDDVRYVKLH